MYRPVSRRDLRRVGAARRSAGRVPFPAAAQALPLLLVLALPSGIAAEEPTFVVTGEVVDAGSSRPLASRLYVQDAAGRWFFARSAAPSGSAVRYDKENWVNKNSIERHVTLSPHPFEVSLPPGKYRFVAERGKEYGEAEKEVEVKDAPVRVRMELRRWIDMAGLGWYSGDTHVHRPVDELPNIMLAEDLNVSFPLVYWVTRAFSPPTAGDKNVAAPEAEVIEIDPTHVICTRNTEYEIFTVGGKSHTLGAVFALRHGAPFEMGVPPVSAIADEAHRRGALLDLDKHDWPWSIALVPVMKVDLFELANNHMWRTEFAFSKWSTPAAGYMGLPDEGRSGGEVDWILYGFQTYYALLNGGFRLRPTAGTASGVHPVPLGFGRVYVALDGPFSLEDWFRGLGEGRSFVTTGPMLLVKVDGRNPGHVFRFESPEPRSMSLKGRVVSSHPVRSIEVIVNGKVARTIEPENRRTDLAFETAIDTTVEADGSAWIAVRAFEELSGGRIRFAHTGPFHVEVSGKPLRPRRDEVEFLAGRVREEIARSRAILPAEAIAEYEKALAIYEALLPTAR